MPSTDAARPPRRACAQASGAAVVAHMVAREVQAWGEPPELLPTHLALRFAALDLGRRKERTA